MGNLLSPDSLMSPDGLTVGVSFDIAGMAWKDPRTGEITGFEADLARAIGEELLGGPNRIAFVQVLPDQRLAALHQGRADMVVAQLTITPDRAQQVDFSIPYHEAREAILVRAGSPIKSYEDLQGKRIAVPAGSISLRRLQAELTKGALEATLMVTPLESQGLEAVANGTADAASNDDINLSLMRKHSAHPELFEILDIGDHFDPKPFGIAVRKGNRPLVDVLNRTISRLEADGRLKSLLERALA
jgi:ABC-type amino acid transport substrate-binding protein